MNGETQLLADGCMALLKSVLGSHNWLRWNGIKDQIQSANTQDFLSWLLDLAEQDLSKQRSNLCNESVLSPQREVTKDIYNAADVSDIEAYQQQFAPNVGVKHEELVDLTGSHDNDDDDQYSSHYLAVPSTSTNDDILGLPTVEMSYNTTAKSFSCNHCKVVISDIEVLREHLTIRHNECYLLLQCDCCYQQFANIDDYVRFHVETVARSSTSKLSVCSYCAKSFTGKNILQDHIANIHHKTGPRYECPKCQKKFSYSSNLTRHKKNCT